MPVHLWAWISFCAFVLAMLAFDLGVLHRTSHEVGLKEALIWSAVWIALALVFNLGVYHWLGREKGLQFFTGYLVELTLSVDNLFVFLLVFGYFKVPVEHRHRVLFWGIVGALIMRAVFIAAGITLIARFHWITYFFGALLVASGIKMIFERNKEIHPEKNPVLKVFRRWMDVTPEYEDGQFFVERQGRILASPLLVVLVILESTDLIFAVDSVPAVLAITPDPFIVFTSNVLAIVGLRSMFFALQGVMKRFHYLHYGLAVVLALVGVKMLLAGLYKMPTWISLLLIVAVLSVSIISSLSSKRKQTV
jgi:TerC family integral membrane protein